MKTMKQEVMELVKSEYGTCRVNSICYLYRWTTTGMGETVDLMNVQFDHLNGIEYSFSRMIESRTYEGILAEVEQAINEFFEMVNERLVKNLHAGYRDRNEM